MKCHSRTSDNFYFFGRRLWPILSLLLFATSAQAVTVLFPTANNGSTTQGEAYRISLIESLPNHTVLLAWSGGDLATASLISDVVYINSEITASRINNKLRDTCIGVVLEEGQLSGEFGFSSQSSSNTPYTSIELTDNSHPITASFATGPLQIFSSGERLKFMSGTLFPNAATQSLAHESGDGSSLTMAYLEIGDALHDGGVAAGRRVYLPWGASMDFPSISNLNANGETILLNSILWAEAAKGCKQLSKRAFLPDGTALTGDGSETLPRGTNLQFLIYFNNPGVAQTDIEVSDVLQPTFAYQNDSMHTVTMAACANLICTAAEEQAIYAAASAAPARTDGTGDDEVSYTAGTLTIEAGDRVNANSRLDVGAGQLWALLFDARMAQ